MHFGMLILCAISLIQVETLPEVNFRQDGTNRRLSVFVGPRRWGNAGSGVLDRPEDKRDLVAAAWVYDGDEPEAKRFNPFGSSWQLFSDLGIVVVTGGPPWYALKSMELSELLEMDSLEVIDLSGLDLSENEIRSFQGRLTNLKVISFDDVPLSFQQVEELLRDRSVEVISIHGSGLSAAEIESLREQNPGTLIYVDESFRINAELLLRYGVDCNQGIEVRRFERGFPPGGPAYQDD